MQTYLALTIGPIYGLLQKAKTTREFWVASYFLTRIAKLAMDYQDPKMTLLSPAPVIGNTFGAGVYPDRVYWRLSEKLTEGDLNNMRQKILNDLREEISNLLSANDLNSFVKTYFLQVSFSAEELVSKSFLFRINELLDGLELQNKWASIDGPYIIKKLIAKDMGVNENMRPVYKWRLPASDQMNHLKDYHGVGRYPSMVEIITKSFAQHDEDGWYKKNVTDVIYQELDESRTDDDDYMSLIKEKFKDKFRSHHKYICIIQSDGDSVGKFLRDRVGNNEDEFNKFSHKLNEFSISSTQQIINYGGVPVYSGGDELLFFAPVKHQTQDNKSIISLLNTLNEQFKNKLGLSQSFGVSITYYKHPMAEAMESAYDLLGAAKDQPGKNYIALKVQKHSGQSFSLSVLQSGDMYNCFERLLNASNEKDDSFLNSVMYKLGEQKKVIRHIASDTQRLKLFFDENFNEANHAAYQAFFNEVQCLIAEIFKVVDDERNEDKWLDKKMDHIYSILRFVHFLNAKDTDE